MNIFNERIDKANSICILGHQNPDGDCLGSALAIYNYILNKYGDKKLVKVYLDCFSKKYFALHNADKISEAKNDAIIYDLCIVVDCANLERFSDYKRYFEEAKDTIIFDHHEHNSIPAKVSVVMPESIATCEIVYPFLEKEFIDINVAMCLYVGLATDSGVFRYKATTRKTMEMAGELMEYGFDFTNLLDDIIFNNTVNQRKAQGIAFERMRLICKGQVSYSYITDEELDSLGLKKVDIDNIVVYLREMENIKIAIFAYQVGNNIFKMSLRSKFEKYNMANFAKEHDGGGHVLAAGCVYYGKIEEITKKIEKDMQDFIEICENNK